MGRAVGWFFVLVYRVLLFFAFSCVGWTHWFVDYLLILIVQTDKENYIDFRLRLLGEPGDPHNDYIGVICPVRTSGHCPDDGEWGRPLKKLLCTNGNVFFGKLF